MFLAPRQLPALSAILRDIGQPAPAVIAAALGVSIRTVYGWQAADQAPRCASLALFWESRWGRSIVDCQAVNDARMARGLAQSLEREKATLQARVAYLERVGQFGSANAPTLAAPVISSRNAQGVSALPFG